MKTLVLTLAVLLSAVPAALSEETPAAKLIARGDRFYERRGKGAKWVEKARDSYEKALAFEGKNVAASWKLARALFWLGSEAGDDEVKERIFRQCIDLTKRAVSLDDRSVQSHFWLGVSYAKYGEVKGIMSSLGLVGPMMKEMRRVIELDEAFAGGGGHRVLGWVYWKLPGVAGGSDDKAIEHLKRAVEIDESHLLNHLCLGDIYMKLDRPEDAKRHFRYIVDAPLQPDRVPENELEKAAAKDLLAELVSEEKPTAAEK